MKYKNLEWMKNLCWKKNRFRQAALVLALMLGVSQLQVVSASKIDDAKSKKESAESELNSVQSQIGDIENKQAALQTEINNLDSQLVEVILNLNILESDLAVKQEELEKVQADLEQAKLDEQNQYEAMKKRIKFMYEKGDSAFLTSILESESITDFLNRVEYVNEVYDYDRGLLTTYQQTKEQVAQLELDVQGEIAEMEEMQANYQEQQNEYETLIAQKKTQVADFDTKLASAKQLASQYQATIAQQNDIIRKEEERIAREQEEARLAAEREAAEQAARARAAAASASSNSTGAGSVTAGSVNSGNPDPDFSSGVSGSAVVDYACGFIGNPYVWGGTDPNTGADCSGFVQYVYAKFGISLPRTSSAQRGAGQEVSYANAQPGDLICYSGHIAIYMGGGQIVHASSSAPYPVGGIKTGTATYRTIVSVRRVL